MYNLENVSGIGPNLYAVIVIDTDDSEDTVVQLWRANDADHLYDQVKEDFLHGDDSFTNGIDEDDFDEDGNSHAEKFEEDWGMTIVPQFIGTVAEQ